MKKIFRIAIFVPHKGCPHDCVFCNQRRITGQIEEMTPAKAEKIIEENLHYIEKPEIQRQMWRLPFLAEALQP